ncbi:MAG: hypothetical protein GWN32_13475, partial [Gemmatimonadetes bacterium]|nr:hypothetical protein [Gemmatimonadota bacterium]
MAALADPGFRHGEVAETGGAQGRDSVGPWNRLAIVTTSLAALMTLAFVWSLVRPAPPQPVTRQVLSTEGWAGLIPEFGRYAALAPDGSSMILPMASSGGGQGRLGLKLRGSTEVTPIPGTEGIRDVVYAPDGEWIAYAIGSDLYKRPLIGGSAVKLAEDAASNARVGLAWLDDGTILYDASSELFRIPEDGGDPLGVVQLSSAVWVHGLPGATGVLIVTASDELHVVDLGDRSSEVVLEEVRRAWYAPTGHVVYVRTDGAVFAQPFDLGSLSVTGG